MKSFNYTITDPLGLHARPAGLLAIAAKKTASSIIIRKGDKQADAKRLIGIMKLGIKCGDIIDVEIAGDDEETLVLEIEAFFQRNL
ncbi:MAG: HPr family phosphocarrier protein [Dorea sp.]